MVRLEKFGPLKKNAVTSLGLELLTFRLVT
jgi:hypothetical protein